jgi:succinyl-CoA synthetase alpha subunit
MHVDAPGTIIQTAEARGVYSKSTHFRSVDEAAIANPDSNLVVISVPGAYAAREACKALEQGKHVLIFRDNDPAEQEIELKQLAHERGRLVMGPDCGTSLIGGVGIGFANRVRSGPIGLVGASGTGIQQFTSLVHQAGLGISHAIGTGSHDLSDIDLLDMLYRGSLMTKKGCQPLL